MCARVVVLVALVLVFGVTSGLAQDEIIEITPFFGYTWSSGVNIAPILTPDLQTVDSLAPRSGTSWGAQFDFLTSENVSVGFLFSQQNSGLEGDLRNAGKRTFAPMKVRNYHGVLTFHWGDEYSEVKPYFTLGLGATNYAPDVGGASVDSMTRFSTTFGGGVKFFSSPRFGFRIQGRWVPTYIRSDPDGYWCSPFWPWGCYVLTDAQYSQQGEFTAGLIFRF